MPYHDQYAYTDKRCYGMTREDLGKNMPLIGESLSAKDPDDLFDAPGLGANDALLVESFAVREGVVQPRQVVAERVAAALKWRRQTGVKVYAVTTSARGSFDRAAFDYAQTLAVDLGLDGFGWGEPDYSADTKLPYRQ